jgi:hypothetical protein
LMSFNSDVFCAVPSDLQISDPVRPSEAMKYNELLNVKNCLGLEGRLPGDSRCVSCV